ncbi:hypothetical protein HZA45_01635 [Candidatus Peregrinibacteria bacterium]|nr:hypothetical protein [Candidatus Peregrinibacteria bacterium]
MDNMMDAIGWNYGFIALWGLHVLSVVAFFTGVLFLIVLAVKTFTPAQLKLWAIWLIAVGILICLFTIGVTGRPWIGKHYWGAGMGGGTQMQMMGRMMEEMMEHDRGASKAEGEQHGDMMQMMRMMMGSPSSSSNP